MRQRAAAERVGPSAIPVRDDSLEGFNTMSDTDWYGAAFDPWALPIFPSTSAPAAPASPPPATQPLLPSGQPWGDAPIIFPGAKPDSVPLPSPGSPWWPAPPIFPSALAVAAQSAPSPAPPPLLPSGQPWGHTPIIFPPAKPEQSPPPQTTSPWWPDSPILPLADAEAAPALPKQAAAPQPTSSAGQQPTGFPALIGDGGEFSPGLPNVNRLADRASASIGKAVSNIPSSAYEFGRNLAQPVIHPIETLDGFKNLGLGLLEKAGITDGTEHEEYADALGRYFLERYGSLENLQRTFEQDPVGLASDLSSFFNGGASLAIRGAGLLGRAGKIAGAVKRAELGAAGVAAASAEAADAAPVARQAIGVARETGSADSAPSKIVHDIASAGVTPNGKYYSVAFETKLNPKSYRGVSRPRHYQEANEALLKAIESDPEFAQDLANIGLIIRRTRRGFAPRRPPPGWTWHHATEPGVMQLVPRAQHTSGSIFWRTLHPHPGAAGGYSLWNR